MKGATSIQERLWELRKDKGLNLEELSKLMTFPNQLLEVMRKRIYEINHGNLITLAEASGVSVDYHCAGQRTGARSTRH